MGYSTPDPYHQPEKFGLTPVVEIDYSDGSYCFDIRMIWLHESGVLYTARDSGCSCPSPFEEYGKLEDLELVDMDVLRKEVQDAVGSDWRTISEEEALNFLQKVREADRNKGRGDAESVRDPSAIGA